LQKSGSIGEQVNRGMGEYGARGEREAVSRDPGFRRGDAVPVPTKAGKVGKGAKASRF
jgi:hypothetical protein